jgi:hypothetical protein
MAVGTLLAVGSAISGFFGARRARRRARRAARRAAGQLMVAEANRQEIPSFQSDLANPYANLQVATQGAEMQAEQADIALASSLDTLRATGAGAGGATALARAAAQSKRGVAASIEKQEARNAQLRAQGEMQAAALRQRGQIAQFEAQEARDAATIERQAGLQDAALQQAEAARSAQTQALGQIIGGVATGIDDGSFKNLFRSFQGTPNVSPVVPLEGLSTSSVVPAVSNTANEMSIARIVPPVIQQGSI